MSKPKDFTPTMERKRKRLARKLSRHKNIKNPWGLATWTIRREKKRRKKHVER